MARTLGEYDFCVFALHHLSGNNTKSGKKAPTVGTFWNKVLYCQHFLDVKRRQYNVFECFGIEKTHQRTTGESAPEYHSR